MQDFARCVGTVIETYEGVMYKESFTFPPFRRLF